MSSTSAFALVDGDDRQECRGRRNADLAGRRPGRRGNVDQSFQQLVERGPAVVDGGAFGVAERDAGLLKEEALDPYLRLAESGALRTRMVDGRRPPTSEATNEIRRRVDILRDALGLPALLLGGGALPLQPTPAFGDLAALRRQLDQDLAGHMLPGPIRLTAVLALVLDAALRSGELVALRLDDFTAGNTAVYVERHPQRGGGDQDGEGEHIELSPLTRAALERWLPVRAELAVLPTEVGDGALQLGGSASVMRARPSLGC
ncbi:hypothetical protein [Streptomyces sp. OE57]|uniref:hypothetical protein n=1 Tax=Streptomyces lacaronensis TaxID=3379885 RepID=UPI0039B74579